MFASCRLVFCVLLGLILAGGARADEAAQKLIAEKGLTLRTTTYVLEGEAKLLKDMGELRRLKAAADGAKRQYKSFERTIRRAKAYIAGLRFKQEKLKAQRNEVSTREEFDDLGKRIADVTVEINKLSKIKAEKENAAQGKVDAAYAAYGQKVQTTYKSASALAKQYEALAADEDLAKALAAVNETSRIKMTLGPSKVFDASLRVLAKADGDIQSGEITLRKEGNLLWVEVTLEGKSSRSMVLDSGSSMLMLPSDFAVEVGVTPKADAPLLHLQQADGTIVEARQVTLASVQVGSFVIKNVNCAVLGEKAIAAHPLLGNTFLQHFIYKVDPDAAKLLLTRKETSVAAE